MKKFTLLVTILGIGSLCFAQQKERYTAEEAGEGNLEYVDPVIGSVGQLLEPTRPIVHLPNQMIRVTPQRKDYMDDQISSFPLTIASHRLGEVFAIKPVTGTLTAAAWDRKLAYDHDLEINRPWFYSTQFVEEDMKLEFTAGKKVGFYRFSFPAGKEKSVLFSVYNDGRSNFTFLSDKEITGVETYHGDIPVYMYGVFSRAGNVSVLENGQVQVKKTISSNKSRAAISFSPDVKEVELKYAISFVSAEQAKRNYINELAQSDFRQLFVRAQMAWKNVMSQIKVEGGTDAQRRSFYTALYRYYERMVDITEDSSYYSGYSKKIEKADRPFYVDDWSWDTYLAMHPLRMILDPKQEEDMLQSYVKMYEQSGWMPTFPVIFGDHACMNGFHSSIIFLDAYRKGLRNFNVEKAYEGMKKNATQATMLPWRNGPKTSLDEFYYTNKYFPSLKQGEEDPVKEVHSFEKRQAVAVTLGHSYDDWALGELALERGKKDDHKIFNDRGQYYRNLWHPGKKMFLPKDARGQWIDIDPKFDGGMGGREYYDENNGWTYLWQVQQDIPGLIDLMGGKKSFEDRLDQLFREGLDRSKYAFWSKFPDATGLVGQYSMGNEPSFHIPYLYNFTGSPWKTQKRVRFLLETWFKDNVFGIPGDEDGGGMSAFAVFSSMGFYPVTPGTPYYTIGSPVFSKVTIDLQNGKKFTLIANNSSVVNKYIQSAKLNGKVLDTPWFSHQHLLEGGVLELEMGALPNKTWGVAGAKPF